MTIHILSIGPEPFHSIDHFSAGTRDSVVRAGLPFLRAVVDRLPDGVDAIIATSDLQGVVSPPGQWRPRLLGIALAEELAILAELDVIPDLDRVGVILGGDLYSTSEANRRGASGDVRDVWLSLANDARWVVGVAGNHDQFGDPTEKRAFLATEGITVMERSSVQHDGLRIAGVGGVVGNPAKPQRLSEGQMLSALQDLRLQDPDILVLHEGPDIPESEGFLGSHIVRGGLGMWHDTLVVSGHCRWPHPLAMLPNGVQVLNVDSRVILMERAGRSPASKRRG